MLFGSWENGKKVKNKCLAYSSSESVMGTQMGVNCEPGEPSNVTFAVAHLHETIVVFLGII